MMIDERLKFYSILEFYPKRYKIREIYESKSLEEKRIYKMYVYSLCFEREFIKDLIWEFINSWNEAEEKLDKEYKKKKEKKDEIYNRFKAGQLEQDNNEMSLE